MISGSDITELRTWCETHIKVGNHQARKTLELIQQRDALKRHVDERLQQHSDNLAGWQEPNGFLLPTEPDADERANVRRELRACIAELQLMAGYLIAASIAEFK